MIARVFTRSNLPIKKKRKKKIPITIVIIFVELGCADDDNDDEEDPELLHDSIYHLNLGQYLRDFLLNFSTHHCFRMYIQHLNVPELKVLNNININTLMQ